MTMPLRCTHRRPILLVSPTPRGQSPEEQMEYIIIAGLLLKALAIVAVVVLNAVEQREEA